MARATRSALFTLSADCLTEEVERLRAQGADIKQTDRTGFSALHFSSQEGRIPVSQLLLHKGSDVNAKNNNGDTPLHLAAERGHALVQLLLDKGAAVDLTAVDLKNKHLQTPLHLASSTGHGAVVEQLLDKGAAVDAKDKKGGVPIRPNRLGWF
ncbi:ankyrin repeat-containing domain protein [Baffinella frigidus]|nr:ankyrin repeat-containing domain protein [Cryptophyta sp. CCMP2293]